MKETDDPLVHYHYANDLARDGQFAEAVQHYEHAIALDPDNLDSEVYVFSAWLCNLPGCHLAKRSARSNWPQKRVKTRTGNRGH